MATLLDTLRCFKLTFTLDAPATSSAYVDLNQDGTLLLNLPLEYDAEGFLTVSRQTPLTAFDSSLLSILLRICKLHYKHLLDIRNA